MASPIDDDAGKSLHDRAVDAAQDIAAIAAGLRTAGASPQALQALDAMHSTLMQMVKVLANAPEVEDASKNGPVAGPQGPMAPQGPPPEPEPQAPGNPVPGAHGGPPPSGPFGPAAAALHQAMNGGKPVQNR